LLIQDKVALNILVDAVSTLAIEQCLIYKLPSILSPEIVCDLTDDAVECITAESSKSATEQLAVLENAIAELKRLRIYSTLRDARDAI
jgi:hypothetical protein